MASADKLTDCTSGLFPFAQRRFFVTPSPFPPQLMRLFKIHGRTTGSLTATSQLLGYFLPHIHNNHVQLNSRPIIENFAWEIKIQTQGYPWFTALVNCLGFHLANHCVYGRLQHPCYQKRLSRNRTYCELTQVFAGYHLWWNCWQFPKRVKKKKVSPSFAKSDAPVWASKMGLIWPLNRHLSLLQSLFSKAFGGQQRLSGGKRKAKPMRDKNK